MWHSPSHGRSAPSPAGGMVHSRAALSTRSTPLHNRAVTPRTQVLAMAHSRVAARLDTRSATLLSRAHSPRILAPATVHSLAGQRRVKLPGSRSHERSARTQALAMAYSRVASRSCRPSCRRSEEVGAYSFGRNWLTLCVGASSTMTRCCSCSLRRAMGTRSSNESET